MAVLAFCTYAVFPASFTVGIAMLTGVIVFLLHAVAPGTVQTALDRGIDTAIGGAIGLIAYALWPTWSALSAGPLLATLVDAQHVYLNAVLTGLTTGTAPAGGTAAHARAAGAYRFHRCRHGDRPGAQRAAPRLTRIRTSRPPTLSALRRLV